MVRFTGTVTLRVDCEAETVEDAILYSITEEPHVLDYDVADENSLLYPDRADYEYDRLKDERN